MKIINRLFPFLLIILCVLGFGCSHASKTEAEEVIINELDLLKNLDSETTQKYVSSGELFPDATENSELSEEMSEVFSLFFKNFDYKLLDIDVDKRNGTAAASIQLTTLDATALARDYAEARLQYEILAAADTDSQSEEVPSISVEECYLLLSDLLKTEEYETVKTDCTMQLRNTEDKKNSWEIIRTPSLENELVGGLIACLSDNDILSPEETLTVYLNTLKSMDIDKMSNYLGIESLLDSSQAAHAEIASALVEQVHKNFNYEITDSTKNGYTAIVDTEITTFDSDAIIAAYQKNLDEYLSTPEAVIDGSDVRYEKSYALLLENIQSSEAVKTAPASFRMINDGVSWKLVNESQVLGNAIFGTLTSNPVDEETWDEETDEYSDEYADDTEDTEDMEE